MKTMAIVTQPRTSMAAMLTTMPAWPMERPMGGIGWDAMVNSAWSDDRGVV